MKKLLFLLMMALMAGAAFGQVKDLKSAYHDKIITQTLTADNKYDLLTKWWGQQTHIFHYLRDDIKVPTSGLLGIVSLNNCIEAVVIDNDTTYFIGFDGDVYTEEVDVRKMVDAIEKMLKEISTDGESGAYETQNKFVTEDGLEISYKTKKGKSKDWTFNSPHVGFFKLEFSNAGAQALHDGLVEDLKIIDSLRKNKLKTK